MSKLHILGIFASFCMVYVIILLTLPASMGEQALSHMRFALRPRSYFFLVLI